MSGLVSSNFSLPEAKETYDKEDLQAVIRYIRELEAAAYLRYNHVEIHGNPDAGGRQPLLILRSPDGTRYAVSVDNAGNLSTTDIGDLGL